MLSNDHSGKSSADEGRRDVIAAAPISPYVVRTDGGGGGDTMVAAAFGHMNQLIQLLNELNRGLTTRTEVAENKVDELQRTVNALERQLEVCMRLI